MKKSLFILSIIAAVIFIFTGCEKKITTEDDSKITYYVTFDLEGGDFITIPVGTPFVDPGYTAMEGTRDVTNQVDVDGEVDGLQVGFYVLTYSAVNKDGFPSATTRTVIIYDPNAPPTDISGTYTTSILRYYAGNPSTRSGYTIHVTKLAPGFFYVDDLLGGWYWQGSGYGSPYAMTGYIQFNAGNVITLVSSYLRGWGDSLDDMENGAYDPNTKGLFWTVHYVGGLIEFNVTSTLQP